MTGKRSVYEIVALGTGTVCSWVAHAVETRTSGRFLSKVMLRCMVSLDRARLEEILSADFGYYHGPDPIEEIDDRLHPMTTELVSCV